MRRTAGSRSTPGTWASSGSNPDDLAASRSASCRGSSSRTARSSTRRARLDEVINRPDQLPGEGEFPITEYDPPCAVGELRDTGGAPGCVEVLSEELRNLPIEQIFERAYETKSAQLLLVELEPGLRQGRWSGTGSRASPTRMLTAPADPSTRILSPS